MSSTKWPNIEAIGLTITHPAGGGDPYVTWARIRSGLGQWRYGLGWRLGISKTQRHGLEADRLEKLLRQMARECKKTWPKSWKPIAPSKALATPATDKE